eukprot:XP_016655718.1 PREDICTED: uncharacterized protein LOC107882190 [Acyrthosiphon pisum]
MMDFIKYTFDPFTYTIESIKTVKTLYGDPINPSSTRWTYLPINYKGFPDSSYYSLIGSRNNLQKPEKRYDSNHPAYTIGTIANVTAVGYYAAIVVKCDEQFLTIRLSNSPNTKLFKYPIKDVKPFRNQDVIGATGALVTPSCMPR